MLKYAGEYGEYCGMAWKTRHLLYLVVRQVCQRQMLTY